jgi:hypothetical protein
MSSPRLRSRATRCTPLVLIVDCARWHERTGVAKITAELSPLDLFSAFGQVGFVTRKAANEASHDALGFLLRFRHALFVAFRVSPWGIASFLSAADGHWPRALAPECLSVNHSLTSGFAAVQPSWTAVV